MPRNNPGYHSIQVGEVTVTALNDGQFEGSTDLVTGMTGELAKSLLRDTFRHLPPRFTVCCFLLEMPDGSRALIDFGTGKLFGPVLGYAPTRLRALDVAPESITTVLLTHGHPDHVGGLVTADGAPAFARAELVAHETEIAFWDAEPAPESAEPPRRALAAYRSRLRPARDGETVLPGVTLHHLPGHTPGHSGYRLESGGESLLIWTDIVHLPGIQFAHPEAGIAFDVDGEQARTTRARVFDMAATDRLLVSGIHLDFPPFGHVARHGSGYAFEPLVWTPASTGLLG